MEDVAAAGEKAERVFVFELVETNGAFKRGFAYFVALYVGIEDGGEGVEDSLAEAFSSGREVSSGSAGVVEAAV